MLAASRKPARANDRCAASVVNRPGHCRAAKQKGRNSVALAKRLQESGNLAIGQRAAMPDIIFLSRSCTTRGTTNSFGRSNFDPSTASDSRPIFLFLFPTWPLHDSIAVMSIGRHRRSWTTLIRTSCRTRGMTNSFGPSNFDPRIASGSQPVFPFPRPTWPLPDSIASMSISRHRRPWKMLTTGALLSVPALLPG